MDRAPYERTSIRRAEVEDVAVVRALTRAAYAKWVPVIGREPLPMIADYDRAIGEHLIDLLCLDGRPIGLLESALRDDHLFVVNVAVAPADQGRGYGRLLMAHAEGLARSLGRDEIRLQTNQKFQANIALYERLGYAIDRDEPFMGGRTVFMRKRLAA
ncbi:MAG TPA: GNAT family N-acetyltransferase [Roseiarcus sp.]|nr:GNAT family N-acetyltransferase [Roseiarcus sp.]